MLVRLIFFAFLIAVSLPAPAQAPAVRLGAAWYPEQWPEDHWEHDLALMQQAHFTVVRIGEFAWSRMEPSEGRYDLDWLVRAVRMAEKHHIAVVLGTPTDAPPAWLTSKYPDTLGTDANGRRREHGGRRQFSYSSPRYRQLCVAIATQLAKRFGHDPNVLGWQIGNEYTDESFDDSTRKQFQDFLRARFKSLDALNEHWATAYWSQTYTDWTQIPLPTNGGNPGLLLEHKHFVTTTWRSFQQDQIAAIRPLADARQFVTTNIGGLGWSDNWDHYELTEDLDLASWDDYVGQGHLDATRNAFMNDFVRGWKRKNFWVMETQPGTVNWAGVNNALSPGETRAMAWQAIAHGADAILYWQWQDALNGQEQYHGAIVGPDGEPNPIYSEIKQLGEDLEKTSAILAGTTPHADVALLVDYDSRWAIDFQPHNKNYDQLQILLDCYKALAANGRTVDVVSADAPLDSYKLVVAPSLNVISQQRAERLEAYVRGGGHLLLGPRSGMKDEFDSLNPQRQPGPLAAALGAHVDQYYALDQPVEINLAQRLRRPVDQDDPLTGTGSLWAEMLVPTTPETHVDLRYGAGNGWLTSKPAMTTRQLGTGTISYLGTLPDATLRTDILLDAAAGAQSRASVFGLPPGVELCLRGMAGRNIYIFINHADSTRKIQLPRHYRSYLEGASVRTGYIPRSQPVTDLEIPSQGVAVLVPEQ